MVNYLAVLITASDVTARSQVQLDDAQSTLVKSSRNAIVATGISESYFDSHFTLIKVFTQPSDRRVMWKFVVNGYEAIINDAIGSTTIGNQQTYVHSVARTLGQASDITKTISRSRALRALKSCIGNYSEPYIEFGQLHGRAGLFLVGTQKSKLHPHRQESMDEEREKAQKRSQAKTPVDEIESEEEEREAAPVILGYINLQTGRCTKGKGVSAKENL